MWLRGCATALFALALAVGIPRPALADSYSNEGESLVDMDLRIGGFSAASSRKSTGAMVGGFHLGGSTWFGGTPIGMLYRAGAEGGLLFSNTSGLGMFGGELGIQFLLTGRHRSGLVISIAWAPKLLLSGGGEFASPEGVELAFNFWGFKIPLWLLESTDGTLLLGGGLAFTF